MAPPKPSDPTAAAATTVTCQPEPSLPTTYTLVPSIISAPLSSFPSQTTQNETIDTTPRPQKKAFRFSPTYDLFLLKAVADARAHVAKWGQGETLFKNSLTRFLAQKTNADAVFTIYQHPTYKTVVDRFKRLVMKRREMVKRNKGALGNVEVLTERHVLMDDIIRAMDEKEESDRALKEEQTEAERRPVESGELIRT